MEPSWDKSDQLDNIVYPTRNSSPSSSLSGYDSSEKLEKSFLDSPEGCFIQAGLNLTTVADLTEAVQKCQQMFLNAKEFSEERKWLVRYLIELRLRLVEAQDKEVEKPTGTSDLSPSQGSSAGSNEGSLMKARKKRFLLGHHFMLQSPSYSFVKCDECYQSIYCFLHLWYKCADCYFKCHMRCLEKLRRKCALIEVCETPHYTTEICPELGLAAQNYCCHDCKTFISFAPPQGMYFLGMLNSSEYTWGEPQQCDYDGRYYCSNCHRNSSSIIPARVVHNWDFTERKVCLNCSSYLHLMMKRPVLDLDKLNPQLFQFVEDLVAVKKLRFQFLQIRQYLTSCPRALKEKSKNMLIWSLNSYLITNPTGLFSLNDLIDIHKKMLLPILQEVFLASTQHIRSCGICRERGHFCELHPPLKEGEVDGDDDDDDTQKIKEKANDLLFPFDDDHIVYVCPKCSSVFHRKCWVNKGLNECRRCERLEERRSLLQEPID